MRSDVEVFSLEQLRLPASVIASKDPG